VEPTDGGLPRDPRPRGWRGRFGGLPSLGTQVEGLLELFFLISPFKFEVGDLIEGLLELLLQLSAPGPELNTRLWRQHPTGRILVFFFYFLLNFACSISTLLPNFSKFNLQLLSVIFIDFCLLCFLFSKIQSFRLSFFFLKV